MRASNQGSYAVQQGRPDVTVADVLPNQRCQGGDGYSNFYGKGIVDALKAVTEGQGN